MKIMRYFYALAIIFASYQSSAAADKEEAKADMSIQVVSVSSPEVIFVVENDGNTWRKTVGKYNHPETIDFKINIDKPTNLNIYDETYHDHKRATFDPGKTINLSFEQRTYWDNDNQEYSSPAIVLTSRGSRLLGGVIKKINPEFKDNVSDSDLAKALSR